MAKSMAERVQEMTARPVPDETLARDFTPAYKPQTPPMSALRAIDAAKARVASEKLEQHSG